MEPTASSASDAHPLPERWSFWFDRFSSDATFEASIQELTQPTVRANDTPFFALSVAASSVHRRSRCAPRHHRPPPRVAAGLSLPSHHRLRPTAARAPHRPSTRAPPQVETTFRQCCHHDAAIHSDDLLLLSTVIYYVLANARKPSLTICAQFRSCRREHGRRAPHGHLQACFARRFRRQSRRGEAPRLAAELVCEACRLAGQR